MTTLVRRVIPVVIGLVLISVLVGALGCAGPAGAPAPAAEAPGDTVEQPAEQAEEALPEGPEKWLKQAQENNEDVVNWLSWSVNYNPEVMEGFTEEYGIQLNPVNFEDNAEAFTKLKQGSGDLYDVVQADAYWPRLYYEEGLVEPLDLSQFPSAEHLYPQFAQLDIWLTDAGEIMAYPSQWSNSYIIWRTDKITLEDMPPSYEVLWDPQYAGRIGMMDYVEKNLGTAGLMLGQGSVEDQDALWQTTEEQLQERVDLLVEQKPLVRTYNASSSDQVKAFINGDLDIAWCTSVGIPLRIEEGGGPPMEMAVPKEGGIGWIEGDMLVKGAAHPNAAKLWINYFNRPENRVKLALSSKYPTVNEQSVEMLKEQGHGDLVEKVQMEHPEDVERMILLRPPADPESWVKAWNEVKSR